MAYVKISDPKIIDLSTISQIISVVNQHSDNITALTSNYNSGLTAGNTNIVKGASTESLFDISSQQIVYGRTLFNATNAEGVTDSKGYRWYRITVNLIGQGFTSSPVVYGSFQYQNSVQADTTDLEGLFLRFHVPNNSTLEIWVRSTITAAATNWLTGSKAFYVNWTAIGSK